MVREKITRAPHLKNASFAIFSVVFQHKLTVSFITLVFVVISRVSNIILSTEWKK